ncbi:MAG: hypothetical protein ACXAEU_21375 [Candidatus Hodarchaeales archaeon]
MKEKEILSELSSDAFENKLDALKWCIVDEKSLSNKKILEKIINLLNHENYEMRDEAENVLIYIINYYPETIAEISRLMIHTLDITEYDGDLWLRGSKLLSLMPVTTHQLHKFIEILNGEVGFAQGFVSFILRDIITLKPEIISNILDLSKITEDDAKKAICWIFWQNERIFSHESLQFFESLVVDTDSSAEVRSLVCEIISQYLAIDAYRYDTVSVLEELIAEESWPVRKTAIRSLLLNDFGFYRQELGYIDKIKELYNHSEWNVRKTICEVIPNWLTLDDYHRLSFLESTIACLDDLNWEVRENAAISLNNFLDLERDEYHDILVRIAELINDPHQKVRSTACLIACERIHAFKDQDEMILKLINLFKDPKWEVREGALKLMKELFNHPTWDKHFEIILSSLLMSMIDKNNYVREKAWATLDQARIIMSESQKELLITNLGTFVNHSEPEIRLRICKFQKNSNELWLLPDDIFNLVEDSDPLVMACAWEIILNHIKFFKKHTEFISRHIDNIRNLDTTIIIQLCNVIAQTDLIKDNEIIYEQLLQLLIENEDRELRKSILRVFNNSQLHSYLTPEILDKIVEKGQWDVLEALIPFLIHYFVDTSSLRHNIQALIIDILRDPISKYQSLFQPSFDPEILFDNIMAEFSEESILEFFDKLNDDTKLEKWIKLKSRFEILKNIDHPNSEEIIKAILKVFEEEINKIALQRVIESNFNEFLGKEIGLKTPERIVTSLFLQYDVVRLRLLSEIFSKVDFTDLDFQELKQFIFQNLCDDPSIKLRTISWKLMIKKLIPVHGLDTESLESLLESLNSLFPDTRSNIITLLISNLDIKDTENKRVFRQIIDKLDDPSILVRNQIWNFIRGNIDLSDLRFKSLIDKIISLATHSSPTIRKEVRNFIEDNLSVFLPTIENQPQSAPTYSFFGTILFEKGDFERSFEYFDEAVTLSPSEIDCWLDYANALHRHEKYDSSMTTLLKAQKIDPFDYRVYSNWAECLKGQEMKQEARKMVKKAEILAKLNSHLV